MRKPSSLRKPFRSSKEDSRISGVHLELNIRNRRDFPKGLSSKLLRKMLKSILIEDWGKPAELSFAVTDDEEMAALNERYLGRKGSTDVLSFPLTEKGEIPLRGEVVVSAQTARRCAGRFGHSHSKELLLYLTHGLLHLLGYDDKSKRLRQRMRRRERQIVKALFAETNRQVSRRKG